MCGIIAILGLNDRKTDIAQISKMNSLHRLRGPDHAEEIILNNGTLALAHSRLSVIDLSDQAHQPMSTEDEMHWIVYNGEVYNYLELKKQLIGCGVAFSSQSDTEVVLKALRHWGIRAVSMLEGIFGFVYVDLSKKFMLAARDRLGVKPLCFFQSKDVMAFSSTVKPLQILDEFNYEIDDIARFEIGR